MDLGDVLGEDTPTQHQFKWTNQFGKDGGLRSGECQRNEIVNVAEEGFEEGNG